MRCPCGTGAEYRACCGPLHGGRASRRAVAATAEQLMRSRYSAFAVGDPVYLLATWHPSTRPTTLELDPELQWRGLEVLETIDGGPDDDAGTVAFVARYWHDGARERGEQREHSAFVREDDLWFYVRAAT